MPAGGGSFAAISPHRHAAQALQAATGLRRGLAGLPVVFCVFDLRRISASGLVARIDYHESIGSTSDRALALAAEADRLPLLVLAARQTAGRGRGANRWWMSAGGLAFSLLLEATGDKLPPTRWPQVSLAAGLAVCEALQELAPTADVRVKWPNDVYLAGRKVCGILSESAPGCRDRLVVGMGINVNNSFQGSGARGQRSEARNQTTEQDLAATATSLVDHDGLPRDLTSVLVAVLDQFDRRWRELLDDRFDVAVAAYRTRCYLTGKTVTIRQADAQSLLGVCLGIDELGRLQIGTPHGPQTVVSGTVHVHDDAALL
jgi:BirA family biotin operon repressor/biotin-[acetyl-CoA-carboxylase] ligase